MIESNARTSAEENVSTDHDPKSNHSRGGNRCGDTCLNSSSSRHSANGDVVKKPDGTPTVEGQERVPWSWLNDLNKKSSKRRAPNPAGDDDTEYRVEGDESEASDTSCTTIVTRSKRAKLTRDAT